MNYQDTIDKLSRTPQQDEFIVVNVDHNNFTSRESRSIDRYLRNNKDRMLLAKDHLHWDSGILFKVIDLFDQPTGLYSVDRYNPPFMIAVFRNSVEAQNKISQFAILDLQLGRR